MACCWEPLPTSPRIISSASESKRAEFGLQHLSQRYCYFFNNPLNVKVLINGGEVICHVWGAYGFHRLKTTGNSLSSEGLVLDSYPPKEALAWPPQEAFSIWFGDIGYWPITHTELWACFSGPGFAYSIRTPPISFCWVSARKCQFHFVKARQLWVLLGDSGRNSLGQCL